MPIDIKSEIYLLTNINRILKKHQLPLALLQELVELSESKEFCLVGGEAQLEVSKEKFAH